MVFQFTQRQGLLAHADDLLTCIVTLDQDAPLFGLVLSPVFKQLAGMETCFATLVPATDSPFSRSSVVGTRECQCAQFNV